MQIKTALRRARKELRLAEETDARGQTCWMVFDQRNHGCGIYGDQLAGQNEYEKCIMFRALALFDPEHDWHEYDWHKLSGRAEDRVAALIARRTECDAARAELVTIRALTHLVSR